MASVFGIIGCMRRIWIAYAVLALVPFYLWLIPAQFRLYAQLMGTPLLWGFLSQAMLPSRARLTLLGKLKFWPFIWIPGLFTLSMGVLGVGYFNSLVIFSYGLTRPQAVMPMVLPIFIVLVGTLTIGVEMPLRKTLFKEGFLDHGIPIALAVGLCAALGTLRSVPFYGTSWVDPRFLFFALFNLTIREFTLTRFYLVSVNLLACGTYHALMVLVEAFILSDVLGPYLPAFHWVSSNTEFYLLMSIFNLLPYLILSLVSPTLAVTSEIK